MREIKFRTWIPGYEMIGDNGEHYPIKSGYGHGLYCRIERIVPVDTPEGPSEMAIVDLGMAMLNPTNGQIIEQYTGLKDTREQDIYEGDIIRFNLQDCQGGDHVSILPVVYRGASFGFAMKSEPGITEPDCWEDLDIVESEDMELEIVGNIHENPELLEG